MKTIANYLKFIYTVLLIILVVYVKYNNIELTFNQYKWLLIGAPLIMVVIYLIINYFRTPKKLDLDKLFRDYKNLK